MILKTMRLFISLITALSVILPAAARATEGPVTPQGPLTLQECRSLALQNNKQLMIARAQIDKAHYQNREAFAAYLPAIDFAGGYVYNQKEINLLSPGDYLQNISPAVLGQIAQQYPALGQILQQPGMEQMAGDALKAANGLVDRTNNTLRKATSFDVHNVFFGAVTLTQPIFMGGKIVAMNRLTHFAEDLAREMHNNEAQNVIYAVDGAYWQVVSLKAKRDLAVSFVNLLDSLDHNVRLLVEQGMATKADQLSVDVKLNTARVDLTKVENGLVLSRMALAQVCGLPVNSPMTLVDEEAQGIREPRAVTQEDIDEAFRRRPDLRALQYGIDIAEQQKKVALSSMLPNVALIGAYTFSNPNMFNGFSRKFDGQFSVGAILKIPLFHWGGNYNRYKAARVDADVMRLRLDDAREMVDLQISQAGYRSQEAMKTYTATRANLASADENLRVATLGFREGVVTSDDVMAAQTAWLKANSENIDAMIDIHLCETYLSKVLGTLPVSAE